MEAAVSPDLSDYTFTPHLAQAGTLPARWYTDTVFLTLETEKFFAKTWQPVGRVHHFHSLVYHYLTQSHTRR
jgi:hypothetical protein